MSPHRTPQASKLIGCHFTMQMDNDLKHTLKAAQDFFKAEKWIFLQWPSQPPDPSVMHAFHLLKAKRLKNKQELDMCHFNGFLQMKKLNRPCTQKCELQVTMVSSKNINTELI